MQRGYVYYRTEPIGKNFDPGFKPELSPKEMLQLGVFGGKYMTDCRKEFPGGWFSRAKLCAQHHDATLNFFGVNASQPLSVWIAKGWIHPQDPRGWFQWYCRYYSGRRSDDDALPKFPTGKPGKLVHVTDAGCRMPSAATPAAACAGS